MFDMAWYSTLSKPFFTPPSWLFGPAWTVLYILMAISAFLVWKKGFEKKQVKSALKLFAIQLVLNLSWSPVFFGAHNPLLALVIIVVMWIFILKTILAFGKIDKIASYLLYPYIAWVSFASILNFSIWILNR
jgi:benzodiazapine receptor